LAGEAEQLLEELAAGDLAALGDDPGCLGVEALLRLSTPRRRSLLRHACRRLGVSTPPAGRLETLLEQLEARSDAQVRVSWSSAEARIWRGQLYLLPSWESLMPDWTLEWDGRAPLVSPWGEIGVGLAPVEGPPVRLTLKARQGGERLRLAGRGSRDLKRLLQEALVPPWARERVAVVWHEQTPVAALLLPEGRWLAVAAGWCSVARA
uniref:tRNA lysidine(34) synthetase TilS n=1 Tax=Halomonas sp. KM-1 TaxID=590061 RepID=UPI00028A3E9A